MSDETVNIRIPDPLELQQYRIQVGDTVEFIEKMTGTQDDLDAFSGQLNLTVSDMQTAADQISNRYTQILQTGQQVAEDKTAVQQLRTETGQERQAAEQAATLAGQHLEATEQERQAAEQAATLAGQHLEATEQERQAAEQAATLAGQHLEATEQERQAAEQAASGAQQAASGALTSEQQAAMWAQAILDAGTSGFIRLPYDQRALLRSLFPEESSRVLVEHLGLFSYDPDADELDDDSTYFATTAGGWVLELPAIETLLMLLDVSARQTIYEHRAALIALDQQLKEQTSRQRRITGTCSITSVAAGATAQFSVSSGDVAQADAVIINPPVSLHPLQISAAATDGSVVIYMTNTTASAVTVPSTARGENNPWAITLFKN